MSDPTSGGETGRLRARLEASRASLLHALSPLTEQEFASEDEDGATVLDLLAGLARAERSATAAARAAAGLPPRAVPRSASRSSLLAPQVIHELAGARHETLLALDAAEESGRALDGLEAIVEREEEAAAAIGNRFARSPGDDGDVRA